MINGNQHYNSDGTLTAYYQERHDLIVASGWKLVELHYSSAYNIEFINSILDIGIQPDYSEYFRIKEEKKKNKPITLPKGQKIKLQSDQKWEPYKDIILNSDINFCKFGWVTRVAKILGIRDQKVCNWMRRYLSDFYESSCYKRKTPLVSQRTSNA